MVTGDSVYGADHTIRRWAERHRRGYVLAVTSGQRLGLRPVTTWLKKLPKRTWQRLSAGEGAKGPRFYDWACLPYNGAAPGFQCALLVRRSVAKPTELAFFLTHAPEGTALEELVRIAGTRWSIESLFEQAIAQRSVCEAAASGAGRGGEVGLDHYEMRSWVGWHRHATLAMLALAYLAAVRREADGGVASVNLAADLLPLTVPEVRRLLWQLVWTQPPRPKVALRWSDWRRRHQQRARRVHWHKRTRSMPLSRKLRL